LPVNHEANQSSHDSYKRFKLVLWIESSRYLCNIIQEFYQTHLKFIQGDINEKGKKLKESFNIKTYWLTWTLFDKIFQTPEFSIPIHGLSNDETINLIPSEINHRLHYSLMIEAASYDQVVDSIKNLPFIRVFLCTHGEILAKSDVNALNHTTDMKNFQWYAMEPIFRNYTGKELNSTIQLGLDVEECVCEPVQGGIDANVFPLKDDIDTIRDDINEEEYQTRRYRLSIDVRTISNLKRPAYAGVSFNYPFLGHINNSSTVPFNSPVRTHPVWMLANTEVKVDNAKASYDFCMTYAQLQQISSQHDLKVYLTSRSHLGNAIFGEVHVDLSKAVVSDPIMYRCPTTNRQFKSLKDYQSYRHSCILEAESNRIEKIPPKDPTTVRAMDGVYHVSPEGITHTAIQPIGCIPIDWVSGCMNVNIVIGLFRIKGRDSGYCPRSKGSNRRHFGGFWRSRARRGRSCETWLQNAKGRDI